MVQSSLVFAAVFAFASAGVYAYVGERLRRRRVSADAQPALSLFSLWWYCLAGTTAIGGLLSAFGSVTVPPLGVYTVVTYLNLLLICVGLWGLLYYLVYLFTGSQRSLVPLALFYIGYYLFLVYYVFTSNPVSVEVNRWTTRLVYEAPQEGPLYTLALLLLVMPQILGALAYLTVAFRVKAPAPRFRALLVSISIFVWFTTALLAVGTGVSQADWWQIASRLIGLGAALTILAAYEPPRWVRRRYRIASFHEEQGGRL